jgi:hypothetical protein
VSKKNKCERDKVLTNFTNNAVRLNWIITKKGRQKAWKKAKPNGAHICQGQDQQVQSIGGIYSSTTENQAIQDIPQGTNDKTERNE